MPFPRYTISGYKKTVIVEYLIYEGSVLKTKKYKLKGYEKYMDLIQQSTKLAIKGIGLLEIIDIQSLYCHDAKEIEVYINCSIF